MGVDSCILLRVVREGNLLVGMGQVQFCESLSAREGGEDILNAKEWVWIGFRDSVDGEFVVTADANMTISFDDRDDRGSPVGKLDWRDDSFVLQAVELGFHLSQQRVGDWSSTEKTWPFCSVHVESCCSALNFTYILVKDFGAPSQYLVEPSFGARLILGQSR